MDKKNLALSEGLAERKHISDLSIPRPESKCVGNSRMPVHGGDKKLSLGHGADGVTTSGTSWLSSVSKSGGKSGTLDKQEMKIMVGDDANSNGKNKLEWNSNHALEGEAKSLLDQSADTKEKRQHATQGGNSFAEKEEKSLAEEEEKSSTDYNVTNTANQKYQSRWGSSMVLDTNDDLSVDDDNGERLHVADELPIFANKSNKALHAYTKQLEQICDKAKKGTEEHIDRVNIMEEHLQNVRQEIDHTNGLVAAQKKEIETEDHLMALAERESGLCQADTKKADDSLLGERDKYKSLQTQIYKSNDEMEKIRLALNWNQEELEQWATAATKKEEDNLVLQKYTRADEVKIKELTLAIESLSKIFIETQARFDNEMTETQSRQMELDKTAESFKAQHVERRQLVKQWQETIEAMRARDDEINDISMKYAEAKTIVDDQLKILEKNRDILSLIEVRVINMQYLLDTI